VSFRRPQKTLLQRALREAERSVSGALFLLLQPPDAAAKADLRTRFVAGVCAILVVWKHLTILQAEKQLSEGQLNLFRSLPENEFPSPTALWGAWLDREEPSTAASLGSWLELGSRYVSARIRQEAEPAPIDWSRREQEMLQQFSAFQGRTVLDLASGKVRIVDHDVVTAEAAVEVLGSFQPESSTYLAGWADPSVPRAARPLPVFGCPSRLHRLQLVEARSEARRACWLGRIHYLHEVVQKDRHYFLGLEKLNGVHTEASFGKADFTPEMLARLETIRRAARHMEPERFRGLLVSQSQEVRRLTQLVQESPNLRAALTATAESLKSLAEQVETHRLLGIERSELSGKNREQLQKSLADIGALWGSSPR